MLSPMFPLIGSWTAPATPLCNCRSPRSPPQQSSAIIRQTLLGPCESSRHHRRDADGDKVRDPGHGTIRGDGEQRHQHLGLSLLTLTPARPAGPRSAWRSRGSGDRRAGVSGPQGPREPGPTPNRCRLDASLRHRPVAVLVRCLTAPPPASGTYLQQM